MEQYPEVIQVLGEFPDEHHIYIDPRVTPVVYGCRKILLAIMDRVKETLDQLIQTDVIAPVIEPTKWVKSLVITKK